MTEKQALKIEKWAGRFARFKKKRWRIEWELEIWNMLKDLGFEKKDTPECN